MSLHAGFAKATFDTIGDTLRGTKGILMEMYRQPDRVLETIDAITGVTIEAAKEYGVYK